jgi:ATP-binding cassette subfamily B (MDR/TAP) protein 1
MIHSRKASETSISRSATWKFWSRSAKLSDSPNHKPPMMNQQAKHVTPPWSALFNFTTRKHLLFLFPALSCSIASGATIPVHAYLLGLIFGSFTNFTSGQIGVTAFRHQMVKYNSYIVLNSTASWFFNFLAYSFWHTFGDLQARSARERLFNALLLKPAAWFDRRTEGIATLTTRVIL